MIRTSALYAFVLGSAILLACQAHAIPPEAATAATVALQANERARLPLADQQDFDDARRGFLGTTSAAAIRDAGGRMVWDFSQYSFLASEAAPDSVHPALWRHARLNTLHGLFKVTERLYQVRGFDLANMTLIEGDSGVIVIDPLTTQETASAALELYFQHRPRKPVVAVIYTHSHVDHFGGVRGVINEADVRAGKVKVLAPAGFLEEAVSENVLAGSAMFRRSQYQFGSTLPRNAQGFIDAGIGKSLQGGSIGLLPPNDLIVQTRETRRIDGIDIVFQNTPGTEAPAEMNLYFPQLRALDIAENATHTLHNLLPLRGAQVRDANGWAKYLNEALHEFGGRSDVLLSQHLWPVWGQARLSAFLARQRDSYKFIHDQTLRLANQGYTADDIAEQLRMPASLDRDLATHGLYGAVKHNVKAVYQRYLGWYDANPVHLDPLPTAAAAPQFVAYMGGADTVLKRAEADFHQGQYRWVAQVLHFVVVADPTNRAARELEARALEQLGYQAESSTWRNAFLTGAQELRNGTSPGRAYAQGPDFLRALSIDNIFDYLAIRIVPERAADKTLRINWTFREAQEQVTLNLENAALTFVRGKPDPAAKLSLSLRKDTLIGLLTRTVPFSEAVASGDIGVVGDPAVLATLLDTLDTFPATFPIVLPRSAK